MKIQNYANSIPQIAIYQTYKKKRKKKKTEQSMVLKREREGDEHEEQLQCRNQWR